MRISPINTVNANKTQNNHVAQRHSSKLMSNSKDSFSPSFQGDLCFSFFSKYNISRDGIRDLTPHQLLEVGKTLIGVHPMHIKSACLETIDGSLLLGRLVLLDSLNNANYKFRVKTILDAVERAKKYKSDIIDKVINLRAKETLENTHILKEKGRLENQFVLPVEFEKSEEPSGVKNGIMVFGDNKKSAETIMEWLPKKADVRLEKMSYNLENPFESYQKLEEMGKDSEKIFQTKKERTIIQIDNLEEFLSKNKTQKELAHISDFNFFAENCSEKYHVTLMFHAKDPSQLESASIAPHRFGVKSKVGEHFTNADILDLKTNEQELKYLKEISDSGISWPRDNRAEELCGP